MADKQPSPSGLFSSRVPSINQLTHFSRTSISSSSSSSTIPSIANIHREQDMYAKPHFHSMTLLSPPEAKPLESFSPLLAMGPLKSKPASLPMSPPISPLQKNLDPEPELVLKDPILYSSQESVSQDPLFPDDSVVDEHIRNRQLAKAAAPKRADYVRILEFKKGLMRSYIRDPVGWKRQELQYLKDDREARNRFKHRKLAPTPARVSHFVPTILKPQLAPRISKPRAVPSSRPRASTTPGPKETKGTRTAPLTTTREDKDFASLPDYAPPTSTLDTQRPHSLRIDWKGSAISSTADPHRHLLHPDEALIAGTLRLDCATYLTSKRRIFDRRVQCLRIGKEFRKTDAQQACKIDVNKASKLWTAFERVGWLDKSWFEKYL